MNQYFIKVLPSTSRGDWTWVKPWLARSRPMPFHNVIAHDNNDTASDEPQHPPPKSFNNDIAHDNNDTASDEPQHPPPKSFNNVIAHDNNDTASAGFNSYEFTGWGNWLNDGGGLEDVGLWYDVCAALIEKISLRGRLGKHRNERMYAAS